MKPSILNVDEHNPPHEFRVEETHHRIARAYDRGGVCGDLSPSVSAAPKITPIPLTGISLSPWGRLESESGPGARLPVRLWGHIKHGFHALDDHWIGDLIGVLCLFGIAYALQVFGWAVS